jgi:hypothetical protein
MAAKIAALKEGAQDVMQEAVKVVSAGQVSDVQLKLSPFVGDYVSNLVEASLDASVVSAVESR